MPDALAFPNIFTMTNIDSNIYPQDDVGGILNVPVGAEHIAPVRPVPVETPIRDEGAAMSVPASVPDRASPLMRVIVGSTLAACVGLAALLLTRLS